MTLRRANLAAWAVALLGGGLYALQAAGANYGGLTLRYAASGLLTAAAGLAVARWRRRDARAARAPLPDPATLALAGVTALCLWGGLVADGLGELHPEPPGGAVGAARADH